MKDFILVIIDAILTSIQGNSIFIIVSLFSWLTFIITRKRKVYNQLSGELFGNSKEYRKFFLRKHKKYINVDMHDVDNQNICIKSKKLVKQLRSKKIQEKVWFIVGQAGSGKSILSEEIALQGATNFRIKSRTLNERGVTYVKLTTIDTFIHLEQKLNNEVQKGHILVLDSFDEFAETRSNTHEEVLDSLFSIIEEKYNLYERIIITSRIEAFSGGTEKLRSFKVNRLSNERVKVFTFSKLSEKSILKIYKKFGGSDSFEDRKKISMKGKHLQEMKKFLRKSDSETIFSQPHMIYYADTIIQYTNHFEEKSSKVDITNQLINVWIKREYLNYDKLFNRTTGKLTKNEYLKGARSFINKIVKKMISDEKLYLEYNDYSILIEEYEYLGINDMISRHLLYRDVIGNYQFFHLSFLEYFLVNELIDEEFETKQKLLNNNVFKTIKEFYIELIIDQKNDELSELATNIKSVNGKLIDLDINDKEETLLLLEAPSVYLKDNSKYSIRMYLSLFPLIKNIGVNELWLNYIDFVMYMKDGKVDFRKKNISSLDGILCWENMSELYLSSNSIGETSLLNACNLKHLEILDNRVDLKYDELLLSQLKSISITFNNVEQFNFVKSFKNLDLISIRINWYNIKTINTLYDVDDILDRVKVINKIDLNNTDNFPTFMKKNKKSEQLFPNIEHIEFFNRQLRIHIRSFGICPETLLLANSYIQTCYADKGVDKVLGVCTKIYDMFVNSTYELDDEAYRFLNSFAVILHNGKKHQEIIDKFHNRFGNVPAIANVNNEYEWIISDALYTKSRYEEAIDLAKNLYIKQVASLGEFNRKTLRTENSIGVVYEDNGRHKEAEVLLYEVYKKRLKTFGEKDANTIHSLHYYGRSLLSQKKYLEAEGVFLKSYNMNKSVYGDFHFRVHGSAHNLGFIYTQEKRFDEAEKYARIAYLTRKKVCSFLDTNTLASGRNLGDILMYKQQFSEALAVYEEISKYQIGAGTNEREITLTANSIEMCKTYLA